MNPELDLSNFSGELPLFPLPNVVQFPHTVLPLHIFEKRYQMMLKRALEGEKLIGMTLLKPGWEDNYSGNPEIYPVACLGKIVKHEPMNDGRSNILLYGLRRTRIVDIISPRPYRTAHVELLHETMEGMSDSKSEEYQQRLLELYGEFVIEYADQGQEFPTLSDAELNLSQLTDAIAASIGLTPEQLIYLLEEIQVASRAAFLIEQLSLKLQTTDAPPKMNIEQDPEKLKQQFPWLNLN